jgi:hypothetical protein
MCGNRFWHTYAMHSVLPLKPSVTLVHVCTIADNGSTKK